MPLVNIFWLMAGIFFHTGRTETPSADPGSKVLIVYLSRTKNTQAVAEMIHQYTGGKLVALELEKPYPED